MAPKAQVKVVKIDKLDYIKIYNFCASQNTTEKAANEIKEYI